TLVGCVGYFGANWPRERRVSRGSIHIEFGWLGIRSVFPASRGTQKLWSVSADSRVRNVGVGCAGSLTGTCSSFADTTPNFGYRYSHQNWCPITTTSRASFGFGGCWMLAITRAVARNSATTISTGTIVQAS